MPSRATRSAGTRWATCASCTDGAITGITSRWDTKRQRLEPDAEQSARPVLRGALDSNVVAPTRLRLWPAQAGDQSGDRKSTRLNSSHANISYAVFCLKKKHTLH